MDSAQGRKALSFGALLGDDWSWVQYGGMQGGSPTDGSSRSETESERFDFRKDPDNPTLAWAGDYRFGSPLTLPKGSVTNYVYAGAVARSPGDKMSWWFSGSRVQSARQRISEGWNELPGFSFEDWLLTSLLRASIGPKLDGSHLRTHDCRRFRGCPEQLSYHRRFLESATTHLFKHINRFLDSPSGGGIDGLPPSRRQGDLGCVGWG